MNRIWAMPNKNTFTIKPINELVRRVITLEKAKKCLVGCVVIDPFARNSCVADLCDWTNDLDETCDTTHHLESLTFLKSFEDESVDVILFDPPYSPRQISECYKQVGREVHMKDTQSSFYGDRKKEIARVLKPGGKAVCFGWNSGGIGKTSGMELIEVLLVPHGGAHNDTICTVEVKR